MMQYKHDIFFVFMLNSIKPIYITYNMHGQSEIVCASPFAPSNPSHLQMTVASSESQRSSHTVPYVLL